MSQEDLLEALREISGGDKKLAMKIITNMGFKSWDDFIKVSEVNKKTLISQIKAMVESEYETVRQAGYQVTRKKKPKSVKDITFRILP